MKLREIATARLCSRPALSISVAVASERVLATQEIGPPVLDRRLRRHQGQSSSVCSALTGSAGSVSGHGSAYRPPSPRPPGTSGGSEASAQQSPGKGCSRRSVPSAVRPEDPGVVVPAVARPAGAITSNFTGWMCWAMVSVGENIWKTSRFRVDGIGFVASNTMHSPELARKKNGLAARSCAMIALASAAAAPLAKAPLPGSVCPGILVLVVTADNHVAAQRTEHHARIERAEAVVDVNLLQRDDLRDDGVVGVADRVRRATGRGLGIQVGRRKARDRGEQGRKKMPGKADTNHLAHHVPTTRNPTNIGLNQFNCSRTLPLAADSIALVALAGTVLAIRRSCPQVSPPRSGSGSLGSL